MEWIYNMGGFGRDGDDDDNSDGEPNSDWQPLNTDNVPNSKPFVEEHYLILEMLLSMMVSFI